MEAARAHLLPKWIGKRRPPLFTSGHMRRWFFPGAFAILLFATAVLWQFRFERVPGAKTVDLSEIKDALAPGASVLKQGAVSWLVLQPATPERGTLQRIKLEGLPPAEAFHLRLTVSAWDLKQGREEWSDGRLMIDWHLPGSATAFRTDAVASARDRMRFANLEMIVVADCPRGPAVPFLRLENLGSSGTFRVEDFKATAVRETSAWRFGSWVLAAAWGAWAAAFAGVPKTVVRPLAAAAIWLLCVYQLVIPGPWHGYRPLLGSFRLGAEAPQVQEPIPAAQIEQPVPPGVRIVTASAPAPAPTNPEAALPENRSVPAGERIPRRENLVFRIKDRAAEARPILHLLLLAGPALAFAFLVGRGRALLMAGLLAILIEAFQTFFGYGFGLQDIVDLLCDAVGIFLALTIHRRLTVTPFCRAFRASHR